MNTVTHCRQASPPLPTAKAKLRVLFVGAFRKTARDGATGGQIYACMSLVASSISETVSWCLLDTTMRSLPPPARWRRLISAVGRLCRFGAYSLQSFDCTLIFSSAGLSFVEKGAMALWAALLGRRVVFCLRSGLILDQLERSRLMRWYLRWVFRQSSVVVCQSESWKRTFIAVTGIPEGRFRVVPNWIDVTPYAPLSEERCDRDGRVRILFLGWVEENKGIFDLLKAMARYKGELDRAELIVCGNGSAFEAVRRETENLCLTDQVDLRGWVTGEDKFSVLREAQIFVLPSYREGMPNALLEAMASGLPVIATRVGGIPETLENGRYGMLIDPGDIDGLGRALVRLVNCREQRSVLGREAKIRVSAHHDLFTASSRILNAMAGRNENESLDGPASAAAPT